MKNALIIILVIGLLVLGFLFFKEKSSRDTMINEWPETVPATPTNNNYQPNQIPVGDTPYEIDNENSYPTTNTNNQTQTNNDYQKTYSNDQLGVSFNFSGFGNQAENFTLTPGDTGKMFFGHLLCDGGTVCVRFGGITEDFIAPMDGESYLVKKFPDTAWLQQLSQNGYTNEIKTNSKGEQYALIYGKKEVDMPYIGEDQMLAVFKLKSSSDNFKAIGFHFYYGNPTVFLNMIDSVDVY